MLKILVLLLLLAGCRNESIIQEPVESEQGPTPLPEPIDPDTIDFPSGPEEMQTFSFIGLPQVVQVEQDSTEFEVTVFVDEQGIEGLPSQLLGFSVACQWEETDSIELVNLEWSSLINNLNEGNGPDLIIGGYFEPNQISMGCIGNIDLDGLDFWYLPEEPQPLIHATFATNPEVIQQNEQVTFSLQDATITNGSNVVVVAMPHPVFYYEPASALPTLNNWEITLED